MNRLLYGKMSLEIILQPVTRKSIDEMMSYIYIIWHHSTIKKKKKKLVLRNHLVISYQVLYVMYLY